MALNKAYNRADVLSLVRATKGYRIDPNGLLVDVAVNEPRIDYDPATLLGRGWLVEEAATNLVNGGTEGAVVGAPGTPPTGHAYAGNSSGMSREVVAIGTERGVPYIDVRWSGTPGSTFTRDMNFQASGAIAAVAGEAFLSVVPVRLVAGAVTNVSVVHIILGRNGGGSIVENSATTITGDLGGADLLAGLQSRARTMTGGTTASVQTAIRVGFTSGQAADITLRIGAPQLWKSSIPYSLSLAAPGAPGAFTRNADDFALPNIAQDLDPTRGTFCIDFMPGQDATPGDRGLLLLDDGTTDNRIRLRLLAADTTVRLSVDAAGAPVVAGLDAASGAALARHTVRFSYGPAGYLLSVNGGAPVSAAGAVPAGLARALLGRTLAAGEYLNGWIGPRLDYYPVQYTDVAAADGFTIRTR
jgi:hypothetical protein